MRYFIIFLVVTTLFISCKYSKTTKEEEDTAWIKEYKEITWEDIVMDTLGIYSHEGLIEDSIIADRERLLNK